MKTKLKNGMTVIAPDCKKFDLTTGKEYEVFNVGKSLSNKHIFNFNIKNDKGVVIYCLLNYCGHLNYQNWIIKNE